MKHATQHNTTQHIAILILIAIFFIAGFNACKKNPTQATAFTEEQTGRFDTNKMPDPIDPTPKPEPEPTPDPVNPDVPITEDTALLKGKDGVYTDKLNHVYTSNIPIKNPNGSTSYKEYRNYKVTITVANGLLSLSGGPFDDYDYKNMKPYTKSWKNGFKALYKDGKEVAHVKVVGNTIQVHVSALGDSVIFTGTLTSTATPTPAPTPTPTPTYAADTYYTVKVPFANSGGYNATAKVSYRDTNELSKLWRAMVKMEGVPGQIFFIRNSGGPFSGQQNTSQYLFSGDNYFYFDDNLNIGYRGVIIKRYKGAAMIPYANQRGTYTVGGVYETAFNGYDGDWGVFGYSGQSQGQAMIMGRTDNRKAGDKDVFVINVTGEKDIGVGRQFNGYGLDVYWKSTRTARANYGRDEQAATWSQDIRNFIGRDPDGLLRDLDAIHHYGWTGNWAGGNTWMEIHFEAGSAQWGFRGPGG